MGAEIGMLVVETIAKIRRAYFLHGHPVNVESYVLNAGIALSKCLTQNECEQYQGLQNMLGQCLRIAETSRQPEVYGPMAANEAHHFFSKIRATD